MVHVSFVLTNQRQLKYFVSHAVAIHPPAIINQRLIFIVQ